MFFLKLIEIRLKIIYKPDIRFWHFFLFLNSFWVL